MGELNPIIKDDHKESYWTMKYELVEKYFTYTCSWISAGKPHNEWQYGRPYCTIHCADSLQTYKMCRWKIGRTCNPSKLESLKSFVEKITSEIKGELTKNTINSTPETKKMVNCIEGH